MALPRRHFEHTAARCADRGDECAQAADARDEAADARAGEHGPGVVEAAFKYVAVTCMKVLVLSYTCSEFDGTDTNSGKCDVQALVRGKAPKPLSKVCLMIST